MTPLRLTITLEIAPDQLPALQELLQPALAGAIETIRTQARTAGASHAGSPPAPPPGAPVPVGGEPAHPGQAAAPAPPAAGGPPSAPYQVDRGAAGVHTVTFCRSCNQAKPRGHFNEQGWQNGICLACQAGLAAGGEPDSPAWTEVRDLIPQLALVLGKYHGAGRRDLLALQDTALRRRDAEQLRDVEEKLWAQLTTCVTDLQARLPEHEAAALVADWDTLSERIAIESLPDFCERLEQLGAWTKEAE